MAYDDGRIHAGPDTFTTSRIEALLCNSRFHYEIRDTKPRAEINCTYFTFERSDEKTQVFTLAERKSRAYEICYELCGYEEPEPMCLSKLDKIFSRMFGFNFEPLDEVELITKKAHNILSRMPELIPELPDIPSPIPAEYLQPNIDTGTWSRLSTARYVNDTVLGAALYVAITPGRQEGPLKHVTDTIAMLLELTSRFCSPKSESHNFRWFNARAFLWTCWQRCQLIYFYSDAEEQISLGSHEGKTEVALGLRSTFPLPSTTVHEMSKQLASKGKAAYICGWNFETLRSHPVCIGANFARFHRICNSVFGDYPARCIPGKSESCLGDSSKKCQRFQGMVIEDQSAHDQGCLGDCTQLVWNEDSYREVLGARAVSLDSNPSGSDKLLEYCTATEETLAISHVWSHSAFIGLANQSRSGQGGRPNTGFNSCLHSRYAKIAYTFGCNSYWIDAACIPDDHQLRAEAIGTINSIFKSAKIMLVCDKDIMQIDATSLTTLVCEKLFVTSIVSDWNNRAWTFLEAFQGRRQIHLLCKYNRIVSMKEVIRQISTAGALEIQILILSVPHFLPAMNDLWRARKINSGRGWESGYMTTERSGNRLSHRPASRPGDDIVIWSLLVGGKHIFYSAEEWWKSRQVEAESVPGSRTTIFSTSASIHLGFLLSDAPRLKTKGLQWAPLSPTYIPLPGTEAIRDVQSNHELTRKGLVTKDGLVADWYIWTFESTESLFSPLFRGLVGLAQEISTFAESRSRSSQVYYPINYAKIRQRFLEGYKWGAILCPLYDRGKLEKPPRTKDIRTNIWDLSGRSRRTVVAICGTNDDGGIVKPKFESYRLPNTSYREWKMNKDVAGWNWRGVYQWDEREPEPNWKVAPEFLIV